MKHLVIHNIGPIKEADIELKRFNFIIGSQSSGKSTIAKILSTCEWIEKEVETTRNEQAIGNGDSFRTLVENFHKMEDYFDRKEDSYVKYKTDSVEIVYEHHDLTVILNRDVEYNRQKICYIPSERNAVTLSELQGFEFGQTNLRSFLFDWYNAREFYKKDNKTEILDLGVTYYYDPDEMKNKDRIQHVNGETYDISLSNSSSGLQSVTPLIVMLQYYSDRYFTEYDFKNSFNQDSKVRKMRSALTREVALSLYKPGFKEDEAAELVKQFNTDLHQRDPQAMKIFEIYGQAVDRLLIPNRTTFIIEEPEQNLYPFTQLELLETIFILCNGERSHGCTITTHSPFILNYLNVLIARFYRGVKNKAKINPEDLAVFATANGRLSNLMQKNKNTAEQTVNAEDLVEAMRYMYNEYQGMKVK